MVSKVSPSEERLNSTSALKQPERIDTTMHQEEHIRVNSRTSNRDKVTSDENDYISFDVSPDAITRESKRSHRKSKAWFYMTEA